MNSLIFLALIGAACAQVYTPNYQQASQYYQQPAPVVRQSVNAAPVEKYVKPIAILRQSGETNFDGSFNYDFQSENGIASQAVGSIKVLSPKEQAQVMQGSYSYTAPDGTPITTNWYADETGFHVEGAHLPTPPPLPLEIARSLEYIRSLPPSKEDQKYQ